MSPQVTVGKESVIITGPVIVGDSDIAVFDARSVAPLKSLLKKMEDNVRYEIASDKEGTVYAYDSDDGTLIQTKQGEIKRRINVVLLK